MPKRRKQNKLTRNKIREMTGGSLEDTIRSVDSRVSSDGSIGALSVDLEGVILHSVEAIKKGIDVIVDVIFNSIY